MKKILIVSRDVSLKQDGGTLVSKRNERLFQALGYKTERFIIPIPSHKILLKNILLKESYGSSLFLLKNFKKKLLDDYDYVFFDGSIYGGYLKLAYKYNKKIICFYHNVESEYYHQKAISTGSIPDKLMVPFIKYNENLSTRYADFIITLNQRDSNVLKKIYGREADLLLPTSFNSKDLNKLYSSNIDSKDTFLLFVGTNFFANIDGLNRFIVNVAPSISCKVIIAGNIIDSFDDRALPKNIEFVGKVLSLEEYYVNSSAVIAPIFSGSGLKTKTAEAISYGKTVIGYPEAFEGINWRNYPGSCIQVNSDSEFIDVINSLDMQKRYNHMSEKLFNENLSDEAQLRILKTLF